MKELNGDIDTFFYDSNIIVDWICRKCHRSYKAKISERSENGSMLPILFI
ncbi:zinc-ribbon domain-containing protein [Streptococcus sp. KHUD_014]